MKKFKSVFLFFITSFFIVTFFNGCGEEDIVTNNPVTTTKGVFVLYEGSFGQPTSYDYAFINTDSGTVSASVFQNSNSGMALNSTPDGMLINGSSLFVISQGTYGQAGTIYKINPSTNQLITSRNFGTNPYAAAGDYNGNLYVTNTAGDHITVLDNNLNIIADSVRVGSNPSDIVLYGDYLYVAKQSYAFENSVAIVNKNTYQVNKFYFDTPPVCVTEGENRIYISTYSGKKIYSIIQQFNTIGDSMTMTIPEPAIGSMIAVDSHILLVLGVADTSFASNVGKRVYKVDVQTRTIDPSFNIQFTGTDDVYGISFDRINHRIYIANSKSGTANGEVRVYDLSGNLLNTFPDIGGKFPKKMAFKYN
ncbi:MAG: hypothetical protein JNK43_10860 [Ignavibacteria bacterium]|nr:hypothetical protein [Ignavibacteria bacterium]